MQGLGLQKPHGPIGVIELISLYLASGYKDTTWDPIKFHQIIFRKITLIFIIS